MTDDLIRLGMRAVECKGWRWLPGMLYQYREESDEMTIPTKHYWCDPTRVRDHDPDTPACSGGLSIPCLTDPATLGCLLALYEETRKRLTCPDPVYTMVAAWGLMHPRTLEAIVAVLEATP